MAPNTNNIPFTTEKITSGLKALRLGKAAGPDQIPTEFYRQDYIEHSFEDPFTGRRRIWREYVLAPTDHIFIYNKDAFLYNKANKKTKKTKPYTLNPK